MKWVLAALSAWLLFCAVYAAIPGRVELRVRFSSGP